MLPAHPPLPTAWNLPFHVRVGIQTSILMSESADGFSVAAIRQCSGSMAGGAPTGPPGGPPARPAAGAPAAGGAAGAGAGPPPRGGVKGPAATSCAVVIVVFGRVNVASRSQGVP